MIKNKYGISQRQINNYGLDLVLELYKKFNYKCILCGSADRLHIHHIDHKGRNLIEKGLLPNNDTENLQILCIKCHGSLHSSQRWEEEKKSGKKFSWSGRQKEWIKEYQIKNKDHIKKYMKKYRLKNKEKIKLYNKNYYKRGTL